MENVQPTIGNTFAKNFVEGVIRFCKLTKGNAAKLRRADNSSTEYQSWEILARLGIELEKDRVRMPAALVAAAIAKADISNNGSLTLGRALALCYKDGSEDSSANSKLRRLLSCTEVSELCRVLRSILTLIRSRVAQDLDYARLLSQIHKFKFNSQAVKAQWAEEFYKYEDKKAKGDTEHE